MRDVAALAGVGIKTVSRVVNDEPGVSQALVDRVREAVEELGFRPNPAASSLRRADGKTSTIALLLEDLANPFSAAVHRAFSDVAQRRGVMVIAGSIDEDGERERELVDVVLGRRADALVLAPAGDDQGYLAARRERVPVVVVDRRPRGLDVDSVVSTNEQGAAEGVAHLLAAGHERIAFLGDLRTIATAVDRHAGYVRTLRAAGLPVRPQHVVHDLRTAEQAAEATAALLTGADPPTALFTSQNLVTVGAVRALHHLGRQHDVAQVGFDDFPLADLLEPAVTVVAQDPSAIGRTAAEVVLQRLDGARHPPAAHLVPTRLVVRGSGEIRPGTR